MSELQDQRVTDGWMDIILQITEGNDPINTISALVNARFLVALCVVGATSNPCFSPDVDTDSGRRILDLITWYDEYDPDMLDLASGGMA